MAKTIYASSTGTGDGTAQDKAAGPQKACDLAQSGDTVLYRDGDVITVPFVKKGVNGIRLTTVNGKGATFRTPGGAVTLMLCDDATIDGLSFEQAGRDPRQPGYKYSMGANGILLLACNRPTIQNASIKFFGNGIVAQQVNTTGGMGGIVRDTLIAENYNDPSAHSQGVYLAYQSGWLFERTEFRLNGWHDLVPVATATMFNHAVYNHDSQDGKSGPYVARRCRFTRNAASGPTADAGAEYDHCYIAGNSNDPQKSPQCWVGGSRSRDSIHDCYIVGGLRIDSLNADVYDNWIVSDGTQPIAVDLPHGQTYATDQRPAGATVNIHDNLLPGWTGGDPVKFFKAAQGINQNNRPESA